MGFQCRNSNEATKSNHKGYSKENMDNSSNSKIIPAGKEGRGGICDEPNKFEVLKYNSYQPKFLNM
jgi:hypothetical protein